MYRRHISLLVAVSLILLVVTACIVRTRPAHRGGPAYRSQEHRKDHRKARKEHRKDHRKARRGRIDEQPRAVDVMVTPRSNGFSDL